MDKIGLWIAGAVAIVGGAWMIACLIGGAYGTLAIVGIATAGICLLIWEQIGMENDERNR